nr:hypothetical protein B0A51_00981 [Rachicladosporium sp. CCFEE 5018]
MESPGQPENLHCQIWELVHLVNAATHGLSTCLSLNDLLHAAKSAEDEALIMLYNMCLSSSMTSLRNFVATCARVGDSMPKDIPQGETQETYSESRTYQSVMVAASRSRDIAPLLSLLDRKEVRTVGQATQGGGYQEARAVAEFDGWAQCYELDDLQMLCTEMLAWRDCVVGWKTCRRKWSAPL